jgi:hypothetical protein
MISFYFLLFHKIFEDKIHSTEGVMLRELVDYIVFGYLIKALWIGNDDWTLAI